MERKFAVLVSLFVIVAVAAAAIAWWAQRVPGPAGGTSNSPVRVTFTGDHVAGQPAMNTTDFWVARITQVTSNESLSSYHAMLLANGSTLVDAVPVEPGRLGTSSHPIFEFFDSGAMCSPNPCPPPEGPDGKLSVDDYFRISYPTPGTAYTVRVLWAGTGDVAGEIVIHT